MKRTREEENALPGGIEIGRRYKLRVSKEELDGQKLFSLQYSFKPANVDTSQHGEMNLSTESQEVHLKLKKQDTGEDMRFEGMKMQGLQFDHQYVLQLDHGTVQGTADETSADNTPPVFVLRKIDQCIANLKYKHSESSAMQVGIDNKKNKLKDFLDAKEKLRQKVAKQQQQQAAKELKESSAVSQETKKAESSESIVQATDVITTEPPSTTTTSESEVIVDTTTEVKVESSET